MALSYKALPVEGFHQSDRDAWPLIEVLSLQKTHFQILLASSKNENGTIDYNKFDSLVNYQSSPARAATAEDHAPRMSQPKGSFFKFLPGFDSKLS